MRYGSYSLRLCGLAVACAIGIAPLVPALGPGESAFSTDGAIATIDQLADQPRPVGSLGHTAAQELIKSALHDAGLEMSQTTSLSCRPVGRQSSCAHVNNIRAVLEGRDSTGTVLLVAHYDTSLGSPGAADNGLGVASLLEIARALAAERMGEQSNATRMNDVAFLFTDAEELGLLGAEAEVRANVPDPTVVINIDARGTTGPGLVHQVGPGTRPYVSALTGSGLFTTSAATAIAPLLPNDTDFDVFADAGLPGFNVAVIGGSARYESPLDTPAAVSRDSVEDVGSGVLGLTKHLTERDLKSENVDADAMASFSLGPLVIDLSFSAQLGLALVSAGALVASMVVGRKQVPTVFNFISTVGCAGGIVVAAAIGWLVTAALAVLQPSWIGFLFGEPYRPELVYLPLAAIAVTIAAVLSHLWSGTRPNAPLADGAIILFTAGAVLSALTVPHAAYVLVIPSLFASVTRLAVASMGKLGVWSWAPRTALAIAALVLLLPIGLLLFPTLGVPAGFAAMTIVSLVAMIALDDVLPRHTRFRRTVPLSVGVALVVLLTLFAAMPRSASRTEPDQVSISYVAATDSRSATWMTPYPPGNSWVDSHVGSASQRPDVPGLHSKSYRVGNAEYIELPAPQTGPVLRTFDGQDTTARLRVSTNEEQVASLCFDRAAADRIRSIHVDAEQVGVAPLDGVGPAGFWCVDIAGVADGIEIAIMYIGRERVPCIVVGRTAGLPDVQGVAPMPDTVTSAAAGAIQSLVVSTIAL